VGSDMARRGRRRRRIWALRRSGMGRVRAWSAWVITSDERELTGGSVFATGWGEGRKPKIWRLDVEALKLSLNSMSRDHVILE